MSNNPCNIHATDDLKALADKVIRHNQARNSYATIELHAPFSSSEKFASRATGSCQKPTAKVKMSIEQLIYQIAEYYSFSLEERQELQEQARSDPSGVSNCFQELYKDIHLLRQLGIAFKDVPKIFREAIQKYCQLKGYTKEVEEDFLKPLSLMSLSSMLHEIVDFQRVIQRLDSS